MLAGQPVDLTGREITLLELFMNAPDRVLPRTLIEDKLYGWGDEVGSNTIEVYIHHLRRKLGSRVIRTLRGVGYKLGDVDNAGNAGNAANAADEAEGTS
jgi:two-component system response regulator QseB